MNKKLLSGLGTDPKKWEFNKDILGLPSSVFNRRQVVQFLLDSIFTIISDVIFYNLNYIWITIEDEVLSFKENKLERISIDEKLY